MLRYRINRPTYWLCYGIFIVAVSVLAYLGKLNGGMEIAMIMVGVPRLHDIGQSGWIVGGLIATEILVIGGVLLSGAGVDAIQIAGGLIFFAIAALGIWLGIIPGESEANKWGDPPAQGFQWGKPRKLS